MKKFIYKSALFILPFFVLYVISLIFTSQNKGDLLRISTLFDNTYNYRDLFDKDYSDSLKFTYLSNLDTGKKNQFTVLTIGDSFSRQGTIGYQNYLQDSLIDVLYYDFSVYPIESLNGLINGDFFEEINVNYVILQCVERNIIKDTQHINNYLSLNLSNLEKEKNKTIKHESTSKFDFFSSKVIKFPINNILYRFTQKPFSSEVYKVNTTRRLFSIDSQNILFFAGDILGTKKANIRDNVVMANNLLNNMANKLESKGIKLIVLISPDKYDIYYDYFENKNNFVQPLFFHHISELEKNYIFCESKKVLQEAIKTEKDIYFYDDTHWSPIGSKIIAKELKSLIKTDLKD